MKCPKCSKNLKNKANYCPNCGFSMEEVKETIKERKNVKVKKQKYQYRLRTIIKVTMPVVISLVIVSFLCYKPLKNYLLYNKAIKIYENGDLKESKKIFEELGEYKNSNTNLDEIVNEEMYINLCERLNSGQYEEAIEGFGNLQNYKDSQNKMTECKYYVAIDLYNNGNYKDAKEIFENLLEYEDSNRYIELCEEEICESIYQKILLDYQNENYLDAYTNCNLGTMSGYKNVDELRSEILEVGQGWFYDKFYELLYNDGNFNKAFRYYGYINNRQHLDDYTICNMMSKIQGKFETRDKTSSVEISGWYINYNNKTYKLNIEKSTYEYINLPYYKIVFGDGKEKMIYSEGLSVVIGDYNETNRQTYYSELGLDVAEIIAEEEAEKRNNDKMKNVKAPEIGMNASEIEKSTWGKPKSINKTTYSWGTTEQWCYSNYRYIYFRNGIVEAISE